MRPIWTLTKLHKLQRNDQPWRDAPEKARDGHYVDKDGHYINSHGKKNLRRTAGY